MPNLFEMKKDRQLALNAAERILSAAESAKRAMTKAESAEYEMEMGTVNALTPQIAKIEKQNTITRHLVDGKLIPGTGSSGTFGQRHAEQSVPRVFSSGYYDEFYTWLGTRGQQIGAAMYEGTGSAGGFTVPVLVEGQPVPLAPIEMGVRQVAMVIATASDIKIPQALTFGTAAGKAESGGSANTFTESDPTLAQFTLSAFMGGITHTLSWELVQDVPTFQQFAITDMLLALQMYEENLFVNGTGTGQAQGLLGNVGAGVTGVVVGTDNYASEILAACFSVLGTLNGLYHPNASWLMARSTAVAIRKAQMGANLFTPIYVTENGRDYLLGYPVTFSTSVPAIAAGATPVLFGDFAKGYIIGDRGGAGINVKILDQPLATQGQLVLLAYRRTDGRVRRSEAIQGITLHT